MRSWREEKRSAPRLSSAMPCRSSWPSRLNRLNVSEFNSVALKNEGMAGAAVERQVLKIISEVKLCSSSSFKNFLS